MRLEDVQSQANGLAALYSLVEFCALNRLRFRVDVETMDSGVTRAGVDLSGFLSADDATTLIAWASLKDRRVSFPPIESVSASATIYWRGGDEE